MTKIKDFIWPAILCVAILLAFKFKGSTLFNRFSSTQMNTALMESIDSTKIIDSMHVSAFTKNYRIQVNINKDIKYYSSADTIVAIYDTSGVGVVKPTSLRSIKGFELARIKEILTRK